MKGAEMAAKKKAKRKAKVRSRRPAVGKSWAAAEIMKLRSAYKSKPASQIAREMKRSLASVRGKISALGLTKGRMKRKAAPAKKARPKAKARGRARGRRK
jgi:hypothetical protein